MGRSWFSLERVCAPQVWAQLEPQLHRRGGPLPSGRCLLTVFCQEDTPGLADVVAVVRRADRVAPVAMRLDASGGRWAVTELTYWRTGTLRPARRSGSGP